jgi:hypothetical protein
MTNRLPRSLLAACAAILFFGGLKHAIAFNRAVSAVASSDLPIYYANAFKTLWLIDSTMLIGLAVVFGLIAAKPAVAAGSVIVLLALMPAVAATLLYTFLGSFLPAHVLLATAAITVIAGLLHARSLI